MWASTLFSTIAGKSQNLSGVRSGACAVDWFSYYPGYSLLCNDITQNALGRDRENTRAWWLADNCSIFPKVNTSETRSESAEEVVIIIQWLKK